jgi:geranylgeranyl pyrophosphate synthase
MHQYKDKALEVISRFPENDARKSLERLLTYAIERKK